MRSWLSLAPLGLVLLFAAPDAHAQSDADRATARELGQEGQAALDKKDFKTAEDRFKRAEALYHAPTLLLGYARAEAALGKYVNASESYNRIIREGAPAGAPPAFARAAEAAQTELGAAQAHVASVVITVGGPDAPKVTLDDVPVPVAALGVKRAVDPGPHVVKATADGWDPGQTTFTVPDAGAATAQLTLTKSAAATAAATPEAGAAPAGATQGTSPGAETTEGSAGSTQRTLGWVALGVGGAGLVVGAITGGLALGDHGTLSNECNTSGTCPQSASSDLSSYHSMATVSTIGFIAGGVLAAGGAVLILTAPKGGPSGPAQGATFRPFVGLGSVGAVGTF